MRFVKMAKSMVLVLLVSVLVSLTFTGCVQTIESTIKNDGTVSAIFETLLTQEEYNQLISLGGEEDLDEDTEIEDVVIDGVSYKKITEKQEYQDTFSFETDVLDSFESEVTTDEIWFYMDDSEESTEMTMSLIFTMPNKIDKTNGVLKDDYTVEFNNVSSGIYYYLTTETSTSDWTKSDDIAGTIKKMQFDKINVANFNFKLKLKSNLKSVTLKNTDGYLLLNGKNYFDDGKLSYVEIYRKTGNGKYIKIGTRNIDEKPVKKIIYTDKTIKPNKKYSYKIRGVYQEGDLVKYSDFSSASTVAIKPNSPKLTVKSQSTIVNLSWNKIKNANGYEVFRSVTKNKNYKKITTLNKISTKKYADKNAKSNKTYYYKIRSYKTIKGKKIYSKWSEIKMVRVK